MNRRNWIAQSTAILTGLSILPLKGIASPASPFLPGPTDDDVINLSCNENPYGPSPAARAAMAGNINISNRYQWQMISDLIAAIAVKNNVGYEHVAISAGSNEILDWTVLLAALNKGTCVLAYPTFTRWSDIAENIGLKKIVVPLTADKRNDLPAMLKAIRPDTRLLYLCNPNNPTATICRRDEIVSFIQEATKKTMVMVDEAYLEYTKELSVSDLAVNNKNLVVVKTFSKIYGLAGSRAGYAIAHPDTIEQFSRLKSAPNIGLSAVTLAGAMASLKDEAFLQNSYSSNMAARAYTIQQLERLNMRCIPSHTNFIYFSLADYKKDYFALLKQHHILGTNIFEEEGKWTRITVGTMQEMEQFIRAIS